MTEKITRKNTTPIKVYCLPEEKEQIKINAKQAGLTVSCYLLHVGIGYKIQGIIDNNEVDKLVKINGDLGRLGGLLKLWLTNDKRTAKYGEETIRATLNKIVETQDKMIEIMKSVIRPKAGK